MPRRNLPPLEVGTAYEAADFQRFEYFGAKLRAEGAILRLHLKNGTTLDLPASESELQNLAIALAEAFPPVVIGHLKARGWV